jgi:hypothetical protein
MPYEIHSYIEYVDLKAISAGEVIHLTPSIYSRGAEAFSWRNHRVAWKRQHEIWDHGNSLISAISPSQQDLEAGIIQLQRAVELRDKLLDKVYGFEKIPGRKQPTNMKSWLPSGSFDQLSKSVFVNCGIR